MSWLRRSAYGRNRFPRGPGMLLATCVILVTLSCAARVTPDGWPQRVRLPFSTEFLVHGATVLTMLLLLTSSAASLWASRKHLRLVRTLRAHRQPPPIALRLAADGLIPFDCLYLLTDDLPFIGCIGWWHPVVYVSRPLLGLPPAELRAALAHEEAHRCRRDPMRLGCIRLVSHCAAWWPLLPSLAERMELRAEVRADRFARAQTSTSALAAAILMVDSIYAATAGRRAGTVDGDDEPAAGFVTGLVGSTGTPRQRDLLGERLFDERLAALTVPLDAPLPPRWPSDRMYCGGLNPVLPALVRLGGISALIAVVALAQVTQSAPDALACALHL